MNDRLPRFSDGPRWLGGVLGLLVLFAPVLAFADAAPKNDSGDTAWMLVSSAFVLFMTPGLALFYGGMVHKRNVLSTFMFVHFALALITLQWVLCGYSLAFGTSHGGFIGGGDFLLLRGVTGDPKGSVPHLAFMAFQMKFAIITPALIAGAFVERMKFSAYVLFTLLWTTLVYDPVAHWTWAEGGWLFKLGVLDFAGGTVVHLTAGIAALVCAIVVGRRRGYPRQKAPPHNLTMTVTGGGLLWFGWFGFNAGSALAANGIAALAFCTTHVSAGTAALAWVSAEWLHRKRPTMLGFVSGLVAGLVAITPAAGFVSVASSTIFGLLAGLACYGAVVLKERLHYDDSLDAFGVHGVGGILGALLTGVFAQKQLNPAGQNGLLHGNPRQLGLQALGVGAAGLYSAALTFVLLKLTDKVIGLRVTPDEEREGLDVTQHGESGYVM
ncbi:MAG: ammonium transporter [Deltaproteobacteria bacterium]|nr:ammonium transporter [Deltaproteobacteria bacterium]